MIVKPFKSIQPEFFMIYLAHWISSANKIAAEYYTLRLPFGEIRVNNISSCFIYANKFIFIILRIIHTFRIAFGPHEVNVTIFKIAVYGSRFYLVEIFRT